MLFRSAPISSTRDAPLSLYGLTAIPFVVSDRPSETTVPDVSSPSESPGAERSADDPTAGSEGLTSSAVLSVSNLRCTATFARDTVAPGRKIGVEFEVTNISEADVDTMVAPGYLILSRDGQQLVDTGTVMDGSMAPIVPLNKTLAPGDSATLFHWNVPVVWAGPLDVTPYCGDEPLPTVTIQLSPPPGQPDASSALEQAIADTGGAFDMCQPATGGNWSVGTVVTHGEFAVGTIRARCAAFVQEQPGFDVIVLAIETPPDGPPVDVPGLVDDVQAQPDELFDIKAPPYAVSWFTYVVTSDGAIRANQRTVAVCQGVSGSGPGIAGCSQQSETRNAELTAR